MTIVFALLTFLVGLAIMFNLRWFKVLRTSSRFNSAFVRGFTRLMISLFALSIQIQVSILHRRVGDQADQKSASASLLKYLMRMCGTFARMAASSVNYEFPMPLASGGVAA